MRVELARIRSGRKLATKITKNAQRDTKNNKNIVLPPHNFFVFLVPLCVFLVILVAKNYLSFAAQSRIKCCVVSQPMQPSVMLWP